VNRVEISVDDGVASPPWSGGAEAFVHRVLEKLSLDRWDLSVRFCDNRAIAALNRRFRQIEEPTDVLSFPLGETGEAMEAGRSWYLPGDIVISLEAVEENAAFFAVSPAEELRRLLVHGILHLTGLDHATNAPEEPMLRQQEALLAGLKNI